MGKCYCIKTYKIKSWLYDEYYLGDADEDTRRCGKGENHWTGPESIEWYTGSFVLNTMHGRGEYRWRHYREEGTAQTYEGSFYANRMHGYGIISYADGKVFRGLLWNNRRWGPGIESHPCQSENVGLWYDGRLVRLTWTPSTLSLIPNFVLLPAGANLLKKHRTKLISNTQEIGETNSAMDLLKTCGCDPQLAGEKWRQLYPRFCTNLNSLLCDNKTFIKKYYRGDVLTLEEYTEVNNSLSTVDDGMLPREEVIPSPTVYFVWNNSTSMTEMMQHCYTHDHQREHTGLNLTNIISGPRKIFKSAGLHELDCRSILMASYLDHVSIVAQLVNDKSIHPDVADVVGNTPLMYAVFGDRVDTIRFLLEAGAEVDNFNDSCFTALGLALMRYVTRYLDVPPINIAQVLVPMDQVPVKVAAKEQKPAQGKATAQPVPPQDETLEWNINREVITAVVTPGIPRHGSLTATLSTKKLKSLASMKSVGALKSVAALKRKGMNRSRGLLDPDDDLCETNKNLYNTLSHEYIIRVSDVLTPCPEFVVQSIFNCVNMISEIDQFEGQKVEKSPDKLKNVQSKVLKGIKPSKVFSGGDISDINSDEKLKIESLSQIHTTILILLEYGADPKLVQCPLPALVLAVNAESEKLVRDLIRYGADIHQRYTEMLNYTALELAISRPLTTENLNVITALLQAGSRVDYRMPYDARDPVDDSIIPGPTLLHAVLAKQTENNDDLVDLQKQLLNMLLDYGCDAALQFRGQSAVELAMSRNMTLLDVFVNNSKVNLNSVINETNQTLLTKIFNFKYFRTMDKTNIITTLTNLMLFGGDPLLPCQNEKITYNNFYVYAKEELFDAEESDDKEKVPSPKGNKADKGGSKSDKEKKITGGKTLTEDIEDYKQALQVVTDCSRLVHTRWLQAQLVKELIDVVHNITHRSWHIIMRDHKQPKQAGLWLTAQRVLEIWDILKTTKNKLYRNVKLLRHILCIVYYYNFRKYLKKKLTAPEKDTIDANVRTLLREHTAESVFTQIIPWKLHYVTPELDEQKFKYDVCLECSLPLTDDKIKCYKCKIVFFCCMECIYKNVGRINCHPCSEYLKERYFPVVEEEDVNVNDNLTVL